MKNLFKTGLTLALAGVMLAGAVAPVFATVETTQSATGAFDAKGDMILTGVDGAVVKDNSKMETEVVYTQDSTFTVEIPKKIDLGSDKTTNYTVNVKGDISSDKQVKVAPQDMVTTDDVTISFLMEDQSGAAVKKDAVTATVTQAATIWTSAEVCVKTGNPAELTGTTKNGNVAAPNLTAGTWKGTFNFAIALENVPAQEVQEPTGE